MDSLINKDGGFKKAYTLSPVPPKIFVAHPARGKPRKALVGLFEPLPEALPLEAGYYTYVIDAESRWHVERGNHSSHAGMVGREPIGAAGYFVITRAGKVGEVRCGSRDYGIIFADSSRPTLKWLIDAFHRMQAFEVSPYAYFRFPLMDYKTLLVRADYEIIEDHSELDDLLAREGQGTDGLYRFSKSQEENYKIYVPEPPSRLYPMHLDQLLDPLDYDTPPRDDDDPFVAGDFEPRYCPADGSLGWGRKAFVLDQQGYLILGAGHQKLSGGQNVGAAGQLTIDGNGSVSKIHLNFSGHFRPPLTAQYARYVYSVLIKHPLLSIAPECEITARKVTGLAELSKPIPLDPDELLSDDGRLEDLLGEEFDLVPDEDDPDEQGIFGVGGQDEFDFA